MEGPAKLFLEYESKAKTWKELADELDDECGSSVNSALIHQQLSKRNKKQNESILEYIYEMLSLGKKGNVDQEAIITYTIEGLLGSAAIKNCMYEANTIKAFKLKMEASCGRK